MGGNVRVAVGLVVISDLILVVVRELSFVVWDFTLRDGWSKSCSFVDWKSPESYIWAGITARL